MDLFCSYTNTTESIQIARIVDLPNEYFERVVFPGVCLLFEAPAAAHLEIHTAAFFSAIVSDRIPCDRLAFPAENRLAFGPEHCLAASIV